MTTEPKKKLSLGTWLLAVPVIALIAFVIMTIVWPE